MNYYKLATILTLVSIMMTTSCSKDDPQIPNEEELTTTVNYTLSPAGGGSDIVMIYKNLDGGSNPTISGGTLSKGQIYNGAITLLNETKNPAEDITAEIQAEDEDHQFFFQSTISDLSISYQDMDSDGKPIGLKTEISTGKTGNGNLKVTLKHEPNKNGTGVSNGDITNAGGETDIEITFPIIVQ